MQVLCSARLWNTQVFEAVGTSCPFWSLDKFLSCSFHPCLLKSQKEGIVAGACKSLLCEGSYHKSSHQDRSQETLAFEPGWLKGCHSAGLLASPDVPPGMKEERPRHGCYCELGLAVTVNRGALYCWLKNVLLFFKSIKEQARKQ